MKRTYTKGPLLFTCLFIFISLIACSPKRVVRARVIDAETRQPIEGAAVAIKWLQDGSGQTSSKISTYHATQALSDETGVFQIPEYPEKNYNLGVYKKGYVCWSNRNIFVDSKNDNDMGTNSKHDGYQLKDGVEIKLKPFKKGMSIDRHAGFTVMVAGESTDITNGPFNQAITSEYQLWRENLRQDFQKKFGKKADSHTESPIE